MLSTPQHGWSQITIGSWSDRCSYIDDVPFNLLYAIQNFLNFKRDVPIAVLFDAEGYEYIMVFAYDAVHIITDTDDGYTLHSEENIDYKSLIAELVSDIRKDMEEWVRWFVCGEITSGGKQIDERRHMLIGLCDLIETMIKE